MRIKGVIRAGHKCVLASDHTRKGIVSNISHETGEVVIKWEDKGKQRLNVNDLLFHVK